MAEAHQAVAFSFSITHEGWDINYDREVLNLVFDSGIRSWKKRLGRLRVSGAQSNSQFRWAKKKWLILWNFEFPKTE